MNIGIITQARMTSTRLPAKVLARIAGKTVLEHHLDRLRAAGEQVIVATTTNTTDDPLVELCEAAGHSVFRGSEDDVLSRFAGAARKRALDVIVRVTSDCPLIDGDLVKRGIEEYLALDDDSAYVSNTVTRTYPRGMDFEVFSAQSLYEANANATSKAEREHVTPYFYLSASADGRVRQVVRGNDASVYRITLDTTEDLELITRLIEDHDADQLNGEQIVSLLNAHPELAEINAQVKQVKIGR